MTVYGHVKVEGRVHELDQDEGLWTWIGQPPACPGCGEALVEAGGEGARRVPVQYWRRSTAPNVACEGCGWSGERVRPELPPRRLADKPAEVARRIAETPRLMDREALLGKQYETRFRVVSIGAVPDGGAEGDRKVRITLYGELCELSLAELTALVQSGVVVETGG